MIDSQSSLIQIQLDSIESSLLIYNLLLHISIELQKCDFFLLYFPLNHIYIFRLHCELFSLLFREKKNRKNLEVKSVNIRFDVRFYIPFFNSLPDMYALQNHWFVSIPIYCNYNSLFYLKCTIYRKMSLFLEQQFIAILFSFFISYSFFH